MDSLQQHLVELSDRIDKDGKLACADAVDELVKTASLDKLAQYVGVIGYVLKQNRAMGNCIRKKRVASGEPMQTIVLECLKEYQDGQQYQDNEWASKYAQVIQASPDQFDISHLFFLNTVGQLGDISADIERVEKVAHMLEENDIDEPIFNTVLEHLSQFGDILAKDSETHANFKLAAPPRGWWSQFWNPTQFNWTNPRSWFKGVRERGSDLDTIQELESILTNLSALTRVTQQIKTGIARLKSESNGYTSGSGEELQRRVQPHIENPDAIAILVDKIQQLPQEDWNKTTLLLQQMQFLLKKNKPQNIYNQQIHARAKDSIDRIQASMEEVYKYIEAIQEDMESLRLRDPILGRDVGLTEEGERNPFGIISPAEEYGALQQVLEKLYQNPMHSKAQWYAQKAHARLWDKLRYIQRGPDEGMNNWLGEEYELPDYSTKEDGPDDDGDDFGEPDTASEDVARMPDAEHGGVGETVETHLDEYELDELGQRMPGIIDKGGASLDEVIEILRRMSYALTEPAESMVAEFIDKIKKYRDNKDASIFAKGHPSESLEYPDRLRGRGVDFGDDDDGNDLVTASIITKKDLVRIADTVDLIDRDVADVIDSFIEEYKSHEIDLTFPEFSVLVKEPVVEEKNNTI